MAVPVYVGDRVLVSTDTIGTGTYDLGASVSGYLTPANAGVVSGSRVAYVVVDSLTNPSTFEVGEGIYTAGAPATISRALIVRNSSGGTTAISWSAGTKYLFLAPSASRFVMYDSDGGLSLNGVGISGVTSINSGPLAGFRNAIINGNFDIWQRGTSFSSPAAGALTADRWVVDYDGAGATRTISRQAFTLGQTDVPNEPQYFVRFNQSVAGSGAGFNVFRQNIESVRTYAGKQVTISFYAKAASNITMPAIDFQQNFGSGGSPSSLVSTTVVSNVSITTSWSKYSYQVTLPSLSGKTIGNDANDLLGLILRLPVNSTFTFDIAQVQVEIGGSATPFERRPLGVELALCQRYYWKTFPLETAPAQNAGTTGAYSFGVLATNSNAMYQGLSFPVAMRAAPTMTGYNPSANNAQARNTTFAGDFSSTTVIATGNHGFHVTATAAANFSQGSSSYLHITAESEL